MTVKVSTALVVGCTHLVMPEKMHVLRLSVLASEQLSRHELACGLQTGQRFLRLVSTSQQCTLAREPLLLVQLGQHSLQPALSPAGGHLSTPTVAGLPGLCEKFLLNCLQKLTQFNIPAEFTLGQ